jgi:DNA polymerase-3 subunit epsilon
MLPFPHVTLDLETRGGRPLHDSIIKIALVRFEEGTESARWETLSIRIPPFRLSSRA